LYLLQRYILRQLDARIGRKKIICTLRQWALEPEPELELELELEQTSMVVVGGGVGTAGAEVSGRSAK
jgi:CHASE1-domain containing sensor protein